MSERVARAVGKNPRRRIGFGTVLAILIVAGVMFAGGVFTAAPEAQTTARGAQAYDQPTVTAAEKSSIDSKVNALIQKMTVPEKFGQLEMAGPDGPNGTPGDLISEAKNGQIGSVLDLVGVKNINEVQQAALQSRLKIPL